MVRSLPEDEIDPEPQAHWVREKLGFITDPHQINVGLTRAKRGMCIIGECWPSFCHRHNSCVRVAASVQRTGFLGPWLAVGTVFENDLYGLIQTVSKNENAARVDESNVCVRFHFTQTPALASSESDKKSNKSFSVRCVHVSRATCRHPVPSTLLCFVRKQEPLASELHVGRPSGQLRKTRVCRG